MVEAAQSMGGWIYKMWSVSTAEEHLPIERNELCAATWINLGNIMLRERSQAQVIHNALRFHQYKRYSAGTSTQKAGQWSPGVGC